MKLSTQDLSISIEGKTILENISISFAEKKRTAIIGSNGAGKSTFLRALSLLNEKFSGKIFLDSTEIRSLGRKKLAQNLAILPQSTSAPPDLTVRRLVDYGRFPYRKIFSSSNPKEDRDAVEWAIEVTKLERFQDRQINTLSGGERQRAWIAMALAQKPQILLLDEPTTYLDIAHQLEVMNIIQRVNQEFGMTVIMVLHDINHALQYADELVVIKDRKIFAQGTPKKILTIDLIEKVFNVRADIFINSQGISVLSPIEIFSE